MGAQKRFLIQTERSEEAVFLRKITIGPKSLKGPFKAEYSFCKTHICEIDSISENCRDFKIARDYREVKNYGFILF